jgi:hypothetical protein
MIAYEKIIELLKNKARNHGADAIMDIQVQKDIDLYSIELNPDEDITDVGFTKRGEAKAIVFKKETDGKVH